MNALTNQADRAKLATFVLSTRRTWSEFLALGAPASEIRFLCGLSVRRYGDWCELDRP